MEPKLIEQVQRVARHSCTDTATGMLSLHTSGWGGVKCGVVWCGEVLPIAWEKFFATSCTINLILLIAI